MWDKTGQTFRKMCKATGKTLGKMWENSGEYF